MAAGGRAVIAGSETHLRVGEHWLGPVPDSESISATVLLRRRTGAGAPSEQELQSGHYEAQSREAAEAAMRADPAEMTAVQEFAQQFGLTVGSADAASRRVKLHGSAAEASRAFGVQLWYVEDSHGQRHLSYKGSISVPQALSGVVVAVLGLDLRVAARHH